MEGKRAACLSSKQVLIAASGEIKQKVAEAVCHVKASLVLSGAQKPVCKYNLGSLKLTDIVSVHTHAGWQQPRERLRARSIVVLSSSKYLQSIQSQSHQG